MAAAAMVALAVGVRLALGSQVIPQRDESLPRYLGRLATIASRASQEAHVRLSLAIPGAIRVAVGGAGGSSKGGAAGATHFPAAEPPVVRQDKLKQEVATSEEEIGAQQQVSVRRYAEARKEVAAAGEPPLVLPEHPDEVRSRMPAVRPDGPEMQCGKAISSESRLVTRDIELRARSSFQGQHGEQHAWAYTITFRNLGSETVQMLTRHWIFVDEDGNLANEVKGPGARGVTPVLPPGGEWSYESGTSLETPFGSMHGSFQFEVLKGDLRPGMSSFSARVARLLLSSARGGDRRRVPCAAEAGGGVMPLTSVLVTERVILGGHTDYAGKGRSSFVFSYDVQFNNARDEEIEVVAHSWKVVGSDGRHRVVAEGPGAGGTYGGRSRRLAAGDAFRVQGRLEAWTSLANAEGMYKIIVKAEDGTFREVEARTDFMGLSSRRAVTHVPNYVAADIR